jgi:hypothetical protein
VSGPLFVKVDWAKNGNYTGVLDDVSDYVRGGVSCQFGRDQITATSPMTAGRGGFALDNRGRQFSRLNSASPIFGLVKPARPVQITRTVGATTYTLFAGHTDDSPLNPDLAAKTVSLNLVDTLADFRGVTIATELYQGIRTGAAIGLVLDAVGWTGGRDLDTGATLMPWWWEDGGDAFTALQKILASEGPPALLTVDTSGGIVFRDRLHRYVRAASTTSQSTWRGDGQVEPVMGGYAYNDAWSNIVNSVTVSVDERSSASIETIWSTDEIITLGPSGGTTVLVKTSDPFFGATGPYFTIVSGSVSTISVLSRTSGQSTSFTITAGGSGCVLQDVRLLGSLVTVARTVQVTATDSASITDYGPRGLPSGADPVWASRADAVDLANLYVAQRKQPLPTLQVSFTCQHTQTTRLAALLSIDLSDLVTVIEPESGVDGGYFVESIQHEVRDVTEHVITFGLEAVPTAPTGTPFVLGTSTLNGSAVLAY